MMEVETPMGYYALFYREVVPDFVTERAAYREEHLGLAREAHSRGELLLAGARPTRRMERCWFSAGATTRRHKNLSARILTSATAW
jgi:uncharacterized protein YciI